MQKTIKPNGKGIIRRKVLPDPPRPTDSSYDPLEAEIEPYLEIKIQAFEEEKELIKDCINFINTFPFLKANRQFDSDTNIEIRIPNGLDPSRVRQRKWKWWRKVLKFLWIKFKHRFEAHVTTIDKIGANRFRTACKPGEERIEFKTVRKLRQGLESGEKRYWIVRTEDLTEKEIEANKRRVEKVNNAANKQSQNHPTRRPQYLAKTMRRKAELPRA